jgi:hypothetical protein
MRELKTISCYQGTCSRSHWPCGLRRWSSAARLLRSWVRIPPGAWMFVCCECCVLSGRGLCGLITRPEESYRLWRVDVCDQETSKTRRLKPATGLWKIQPQRVVTPGKRTNNRVHVLEKENKSVTRGKIHLLKIRGMLSFDIIVLLCYKASSVSHRMPSFHFVGLAFHIPNHSFLCVYFYLYSTAEKNYLKLTFCIIIVYYGPFYEKFQMMFALNKKPS